MWRVDKEFNNTWIVMGFFTNEHVYDAVVTLIFVNKRFSKVRGLLSRRGIRIKPEQWVALWTTILTTVESEYLVFEAFPIHANVYKRTMHVSKTTKRTTSDGYPIERLFVHRDAKLRLP